MREIRPSESRGRTDAGWLESAHSFSFGRYYDPDRMGFGPLRVLNEDRMAPGRGFPSHPHRDMEIVSYVLQGVLDHGDDHGHHSRLDAGCFQRMTAGTGIRHSEWNPSESETLHFLQVWIEPSHQGLEPGYQEYRPAGGADALEMIASGRDPEAPILLHQDASLSRLTLATGEEASLALDPGRRGWLQIVDGRFALDEGDPLEPGDAVAFEGESVAICSLASGQALVFDLP